MIAVYTPQTWANGMVGNTPLSAARLTVIEAGIAAATDGARALEGLGALALLTAQTFTDPQKTQGRANLGAGSAAEVAAALAAAQQASAAIASTGVTRRARLASDAATTSTGMTTIALFPGAAAGRYLLEVVGRCRSGGGAAARAAVTAPFGTSVEQAWVDQATTTSARTITPLTAVNTPAGVSPGPAHLPFLLRAHIVTTVESTIGLGFSSSVSGSTATFEAGTTATLIALS